MNKTLLLGIVVIVVVIVIVGLFASGKIYTTTNGYYEIAKARIISNGETISVNDVHFLINKKDTVLVQFKNGQWYMTNYPYCDDTTTDSTIVRKAVVLSVPSKKISHQWGNGPDEEGEYGLH